MARLTNRQAAVLAAVERLGRPNVLELHAQFPDLTPSAIAKVLYRLHELGHIDCAGEPGLIYMGGVEFWAKRRGAGPSATPATALLGRLRAEFGDDRAWPHASGRDVVLAVPMTDIELALNGDDGPFHKISSIVAQLRAGGLVGALTIGTEIRYPRGEPSIVVHFRTPLP